MGVLKFEDLIAWQKSQELAINIYKQFSTLKDFGFKDQIQRAAISISNNIAEGFDRQSNKEFSRFLYYAIGSASEVKSMLYLIVPLNYGSRLEMDTLLQQTNEVSRVLRGLIKSINKSSKQTHD